MSTYNQLTLQSRRNRKAIKNAVGGSVLAVRERELALFSENRDSAVALRLASIRTEFQRIFSGRPVRLESLERAVQLLPAISPEGFECDLATEPEAVEVVGG